MAIVGEIDFCPNCRIIIDHAIKHADQNSKLYIDISGAPAPKDYAIIPICDICKNMLLNEVEHDGFTVEIF